MPQVDFVTFFIIIFWFSFFLFLGFIFFNLKILALLFYQKKNIIKLENFKLAFLLQKKFIFLNYFFEKKINVKL